MHFWASTDRDIFIFVIYFEFGGLDSLWSVFPNPKTKYKQKRLTLPLLTLILPTSQFVYQATHLSIKATFHYVNIWFVIAVITVSEAKMLVKNWNQM